jgi:hypothetical protein
VLAETGDGNFHLGGQGGAGDGFDQIAEYADGFGAVDQLAIAEGADDEDGAGADIQKLLGQVQAVVAAQANVGQDQIGLLGTEDGFGLGGIGSRADGLVAQFL